MSKVILKTKKHFSNEQKGMAIIAAIFLCLILTALGAIAITVATGDIKSSVALVGEKRALAAAEKGVARLIDNFNPYDLAASQKAKPYPDDYSHDPQSLYQIGMPTGDIPGDSEFIPLTGGAMGGAQVFYLKRYDGDVRGIHTTQNTSVRVRVGLGWGPVSPGTEH